MFKKDKPLFGLFHDRIELANYIFNLRMKNLQRFADRRSIVEKYIGGLVEIHAHAHCAQVLSDGSHHRVCFRLRNIGAQVHSRSCEMSSSGQLNEVSVLIDIGQPVEKLKMAALVRLEPLDHCEVFVREMFETARPILGEELRLVIDRKLSAILDRAGVDACEDVNDMVERCSKVQHDLADKNEELRERLLVDSEVFAANVILTVGNSNLNYSFTEIASERFQLRQLFACPFNPEFGLLKSAHLL
jgi:hypothetical protein